MSARQALITPLHSNYPPPPPLWNRACLKQGPHIFTREVSFFFCGERETPKAPLGSGPRAEGGPPGAREEAALGPLFRGRG